MGCYRGLRRCPVSRRRLAELTAALERLRAEDGEKERAVEALTLQLQDLVSAGHDELRGGMRAEVGGCKDARWGTMHAACRGKDACQAVLHVGARCTAGTRAVCMPSCNT